MNTTRKISFSPYISAAENEFSGARGRIDAVEKQLTKQLGGRSKGSLSRAVLSPVIFTAAAIALFIFGYKYMINWLAALALVVSLAFAVVMFADALSKKTYYGSVFRYSSKLSSIRSDINSAERNTEGFFDTIRSRRQNGWEYNIPLKPSVLDELGATADQLGKLRSSESGGMNKLKNVLYYVTAAINTIAGASALLGIAGDFIKNIFSEYSLSDGTINILTLVGVALVLVIVLLLAKLIWGIRLRVTGPAMLYTLAGPAIYMIFMLLITLLVFVVIWLVQIVIALAVGAAGLAVAYTFCCGG